MDELTTDICSSIVTEVFKTCLSGATIPVELVNNFRKKHDIFRIAEKKYLKKCDHFLGYSKVIGKEEPLSIRSIYVRVNFLEKISKFSVISLYELEKAFDKDKRRIGAIVNTIPGDKLISSISYVIDKEKLSQALRRSLTSDQKNILWKHAGKRFYGTDSFLKFLERIFEGKISKSEENDIIDKFRAKQHYIVLGKPGAGKTTYLKYLALQAIDNKLENKLIPIFIPLKEYSVSECKSLVAYIINDFKLCGFSDYNEFVARVLESGKFLVLLDGLDEVQEDKKNHVLSEIQSFVKEYEENTIVASCRIAAYDYSFESFKELELSDFNDEQVEKFAHNWFKDENIINKFLNSLKENPQVAELGTNPLLLTLICISYEQTLEFPANRAELFQEAIDALMRVWDARRRIYRSQVPYNISKKQLEFILCQLATDTFSKNMYFFKKSYALSFIESYFEKLVNHNDNNYLIDADKIINTVEANYGLIVERAKNIYSFSHLSIQEFFAAKDAIQNSRKLGFGYVIDNLIDDIRWREVCILISQFLPDPEDFILSFHAKISEYAKNHNIIKYFNDCAYCSNLEYRNMNINERLCNIVIAANSTSVRGKPVADKIEKQHFRAHAEMNYNAYNLLTLASEIINIHRNANDIDRVVNVVNLLNLNSCYLSTNDGYCNDISFYLKKYIELNICLLDCIDSCEAINKNTKIEIYNNFLK